MYLVTVPPLAPELVCDDGIGCRQVSSPPYIRRSAYLPGASPTATLQVGVARRSRSKQLELRAERLDVNAVPAALVEMLGNGRMLVPGAHVDIEPARVFVKETVQHHILEVLGIRIHVARSLRGNLLVDAAAIGGCSAVRSRLSRTPLSPRRVPCIKILPRASQTTRVAESADLRRAHARR